MADSGARGSDKQIKQLCRYAWSDGRYNWSYNRTSYQSQTSVKVLKYWEYFMSAHGARKGMSDTALRTADSGYLTRRMVDVLRELIVRETDCCENRPENLWYVCQSFMDGKKKSKTFRNVSQVVLHVRLSQIKMVILVKANHMITPRRAARIMSEGVSKTGGPIEEVKIHTILTCKV